MVKLSSRLQRIADFVRNGDKIADIGTDHGFLPIDLWMKGICPHVILSDINKGPLEKAKANIQTHCPGQAFDIRLGSGLRTIDKQEVDTIIIAGMGGLLIADILEENIKKSESFSRLILQPRNAQDKLRRWLLEHQFSIIDEALVEEGKYICEIIVAEPAGKGDDLPGNNTMPCDSKTNDLDLEISPILFERKDPLLNNFIKNKIRIEEKIRKDIIEGGEEKNREKLNATNERLIELRNLLNRSEKNEY